MGKIGFKFVGDIPSLASCLESALSISSEVTFLLDRYGDYPVTLYSISPARVTLTITQIHHDVVGGWSGEDKLCTVIGDHRSVRFFRALEESREIDMDFEEENIILKTEYPWTKEYKIPSYTVECREYEEAVKGFLELPSEARIAVYAIAGKRYVNVLDKLLTEIRKLGGSEFGSETILVVDREGVYAYVLKEEYMVHLFTHVKVLAGKTSIYTGISEVSKPIYLSLTPTLVRDLDGVFKPFNRLTKQTPGVHIYLTPKRDEARVVKVRINLPNITHYIMFPVNEVMELPREITRSSEIQTYLKLSEELYKEVKELAEEKEKDTEVREILKEYYDKVLEGMDPKEAIEEARKRINELLGVKPAPPKPPTEELREYAIKVAVEEGLSREEAEKLVSELWSDIEIAVRGKSPEEAKKIIESMVRPEARRRLAKPPAPPKAPPRVPTAVEELPTVLSSGDLSYIITFGVPRFIMDRGGVYGLTIDMEPMIQYILMEYLSEKFRRYKAKTGVEWFATYWWSSMRHIILRSGVDEALKHFWSRILSELRRYLIDYGLPSYEEIKIKVYDSETGRTTEYGFGRLWIEAMKYYIYYIAGVEYTDIPEDARRAVEIINEWRREGYPREKVVTI